MTVGRVAQFQRLSFHPVDRSGEFPAIFHPPSIGFGEVLDGCPRCAVGRFAVSLLVVVAMAMA